MSAEELVLRPVCPEDESLLLEWRNDPDTRRQSIVAMPVSRDDHRRWFRNQLATTDRSCLLVAELAGEPIGQVRVDRVAPGVGELSVSVAIGARGRRVGRRLIAEGSEAAAVRLGLVEIVAVVKPANVASLRAFEAAGYKTEGEEVREGVPLRRVRWRPRSS